MKGIRILYNFKGNRFQLTKKKLLKLVCMDEMVLQHSDKYNHWSRTSPRLAFEAQEKLLEGVKHQTKLVKVNEKDHINTIVINEGKPKNLVMCHGYGAGLGFYWKNYGLLSTLNYNIYALDWLGMANSSRPKFVKASGDIETDISNAENFFIESLEEWRKEMKLETITLLGHSLGGYLSTCYSLKYPERVEKLILVSPVGVPPAPTSTPEQLRNTSFLLKTFRKLWSLNLTPMSLMRSLGPAGPNLMRKYTSRRFSHLPAEEISKFEEYLYHISAQPGSGEYALARLLLPGAYARSPLCHRLLDLRMPVTFIYGNKDWMDFNHATRLLPIMKKSTKVAVVEDAGHHIYLDNHTAFTHSIMQELQEMPRHHEVVYYEN